MKTEIMKLRTITMQELLKRLNIDSTKESLYYISEDHIKGEVTIKTKINEVEK